MLTNQEKQQIIDTYKTHENDNGSPQVQIAILTEKIARLTDHLKENRKDFHSRRGLIKMVSQRKKHLAYLKRIDQEAFADVVSKLGIRA